MIAWLGYASIACGAWAYTHWMTDIGAVLLWQPLDRLVWPPAPAKSLEDRRDAIAEAVAAKHERRREGRRLVRLLAIVGVLAVVWSGALHVEASKRAMLEAQREAARRQPPPWGCLTAEEREHTSGWEWFGHQYLYPQLTTETTCAEWMARVHASTDPDLIEVWVDTLFVAPGRLILLTARSVSQAVHALLAGLGWLQELLVLSFGLVLVLGLVFLLLWFAPTLARVPWQAVWQVMRGRTRDDLQEEGSLLYATVDYPHLTGEWLATQPLQLKEC